jgi:tetratricopeptide (TPR) repeat protein
MYMDLNNPVIKLCVEGTRAEFQGQIERARTCYQKAWESAQDDYEACIAAHYLARHQDRPEERLHWNRVALEKAEAVGDARVREFYPSLYLNMGRSHELMGNRTEAKRYYDLAAELGIFHDNSQ